MLMFRHKKMLSFKILIKKMILFFFTTIVKLSRLDYFHLLFMNLFLLAVKQSSQRYETEINCSSSLAKDRTTMNVLFLVRFPKKLYLIQTSLQITFFSTICFGEWLAHKRFGIISND